MRPSVLFLYLIAIALLQCHPRHSAVPGEPVLTVNGTAYTLEDYRDFERMRFVYPVMHRDNLFPGDRHVSTQFIETIVLLPRSRQFHAELQNDPEYQWRRTFFLGNLFLKSVVVQNLGSTDAELLRWFEQISRKEPGVFKETVFEKARDAVAEHRFLKKYPPDSAFVSYFTHSSQHALEQIWLKDVKKDIPSFFRKNYFRKKYNRDFPDDPAAIYGERGLVSDAEVDMVIGWLDTTSRSQRQLPAFRKKIAGQMVGWKLFCDQARRSGFDRDPLVVATMVWFERYLAVDHYVNRRFVPPVVLYAAPDNELLALLFSDLTLQVDTLLPAGWKQAYLDSLQRVQRVAVANQALYTVRDSQTISFHAPQLTDEIAPGPGAILARADSLVENGFGDLAEKSYQLLIRSFPLTPQGVTALRNLADLYLERKMYAQAVRFYRRYTLASPAQDEIAQSLLFIAHCYQQLDQPALARQNLAYIIRKMPDSQSCTDARALLQMIGN